MKTIEHNLAGSTLRNTVTPVLSQRYFASVLTETEWFHWAGTAVSPDNQNPPSATDAIGNSKPVMAMDIPMGNPVLPDKDFQW